MDKLTQEHARMLFDYREDGELVWLASSGGSKSGACAGSPHKDGYLCTSVYRKRYLNHRLVWLWHKGYIPETDIDHINRKRDDNRIENLREVSRQCNSRNSGNSRNNVSGVKGVSFCARIQKWQSHIMVNGKSIGLGYFISLEEAVCARLAAEQAENWSGCDSHSPAFRYVQKYIQVER